MSYKKLPMDSMDEQLKQLLNQLERHGTINQEDIPTLIEKVRDLYWSRELAWLQYEQLEKEMEHTDEI
jgi:hypothetical protein